MNPIIIISLFLVLIFFGGLYDVVWIPTRKRDYDRIANLANLSPGITFYDLGSGTANMLFYLARKHNIKCVGVEISPLLYIYSKVKSIFLKDVKIYYGNLFNIDLKYADIIYLYLYDGIYPKIIDKLNKDAKEGTKIIMACWPFENLQPIRISKEKSKTTYYLYDMKKPLFKL